MQNEALQPPLGKATAKPRAPARRGRRQQKEPAPPPPTTGQPRLRSHYREAVVPALMGEFGYKNPMQVPRLSKVVLNMGVGEARDNIRALEAAERDLASLAGQHPITTRAHKSIAGFKIRTGMPIGTKVTLRRQMMYVFLDKLINAALPRIRDFRGVSSQGFDGRGNCTLGIREQIIFPEIDYGEVERIRGLEVNIVTTAHSDEEGRKLLELLGMPFSRS